MEEKQEPFIVAHSMKPGDKVLLTTDRDMAPDECKAMVEALRDRFPDVEFTFLNGVTGMAVYDA